MISSLSRPEDFDNSLDLSQRRQQPLYLVHVGDLDGQQSVGGSGFSRCEVETYYFKIVVVANL